MKICIKCKEEKELTEFANRKENKDGLKMQCKICCKEYFLKYYIDNKEKIDCQIKQNYKNNREELLNKRKEYYKNNLEIFKESSKKYRLNNIEKIKEYNKEYRLNNKEKRNKQNKEYRLKNIEKSSKYGKIYRNLNSLLINERSKKRRLIDPLFKLRCNIRSNIQSAIKRMGYSKKTKTYQILGCTFEEFKQHLEKKFTKNMTWENQGEWHLDHIYPISLAKDEEELIRLNHYTNFQPLWAIDNIKKGNKII